MTTRKAFLLGILLGQVVMLPYMIYLIAKPRIIAVNVPTKAFFYNETRHLQIADIPEGHTLNIYISSYENVNEEFQKVDPGPGKVAGFYNPETNTIWCIYDPLILHHEIRHVTEGDYHR